jgi:uncharacterized membrane protein
MSILPFFKAKPFFSEDEKQSIVSTIKAAELKTSGEIRVYVESRNAYVDPADRAKEVFYDLKMDKTDDKNAVLIYIAMKDKQISLFADGGIYVHTGASYWNAAIKNMIENFEKNNVVDGIKSVITTIGQTLQDKFPYDKIHDKNELPDEIVFGN